MNLAEQFNQLNGLTVNRKTLEKLLARAEKEKHTIISKRIIKVLKDNKDGTFNIELKNLVEPFGLNGVEQEILLPHLEYLSSDDSDGLNGVSSDDIADYITNLIIQTIKEVGNLPWQKNWVGTGSVMGAKNYVSKMPYTGINGLLLNFDVKYNEDGRGYLVPIVFTQPYYLTFNQIKEAGATLNKDSKARRVIYYSKIYKYNDGDKDFKTTDEKKWLEFSSSIQESDLEQYADIIPFLKYYNVFRADDCTGLKFPALPSQKNVNPIETAQAIIDNYPNHPVYNYGGDEAYYLPSSDLIQMPTIESFREESNFYCTFFHEITHSTGAKKRLNRELFGFKQNPTKYAFEELIAELGAVFMCAESGILFSTIKNSATYLKDWNKRLVAELEDDNRFFLKAAAQSQKAVNYVLDKNAEIKVVAKPATKKVVAKPATKKVVEKPATKKVVAKPATKKVVAKPATKKVVAKPATKKVVAKPATKKTERENKNLDFELNSTIFNVPINEINMDTARFQNRDKLNEQVLNNIVENYNETDLDPVILWKDPVSKKVFLLAGHHRLEATKRVGKKSIPAKYKEATEAQAIKYAKEESNANRSLETPIERAKIYREMRLKGISKKQIALEAIKYEPRSNFVIALSYLEPKGIVIENLQKFENSDAQNLKSIETIAEWIGTAKAYNNLSGFHEKEMFDFLQNKEDSKRYKNKSDFVKKINSIASAFDFKYTDSLNLKNIKYKSEGEIVYNAELENLQDKLDTAINNKADLKARITDPTNKNFISPSSKDYNNILEALDNSINKYNSEIEFLQKKIIELTRNKKNYIGAGNNQIGLFGTSKNRETTDFNKQILLAKKNGFKTTQIFNLGTAKNEFKNVVGNTKILLSGSVLKKTMLKDSNHCMTFENYINLPDYINNPIAIFKSKTVKNGIVVLTEIKNVLNKPLLVIFHINEHIKISDVRSIYSKNDIKIFNKWFLENLLIYANKNNAFYKLIVAPIATKFKKDIYNSKDNKNNTNKAIEGLNINKNSIAYKLANNKNDAEYFKISDKNIENLLGKIEVKKKDSVFISLTGGEGSMKTRMAFQFINCFAQNYKVGHASIEEHPESVLYYDKVKQYLNDKALLNVHNPEINTINDLHKLIQENDVIVIDSYTKMKEIEKTFEVDKDLRKKYNGKLFIVIFQQTTNGAMRGGSKSQFDGDIVLFTEKFEDYTKNYVYATKNRYSKNIGVKFNIFNKKVVGDTSPVKKLSFVVNG